MKVPKVTKEIFIERLAEKTRDDIELKGDFHGYNKEVTLFHTTCKREFSVTARAFLQLPNCRLCSNEAFTKARQEKNKREFYRKFSMKPYSMEYTFLSDYQKSNKKIKVQHKICGKPFFMTPNKLVNGQQCSNKECVGKRIREGKMKSIEQFDKELIIKWNGEFIAVGEYRGSKEKVNVFHKRCGKIIDAYPNNLLKGHDCKVCTNNYKRSTLQFERELQEVHGSEYSVMGTYKSRHDPILIKHNKCNTVDFVTPNSLLRGHSCAFCWGNKKLSTTQFSERLKEADLDQYILLTQYQNMKTPVFVFNSKCGHKNWAYPEVLLRGSGCPFCNMSHGEERIASFLQKNNLEYEFQYTFEDCRHKNLLRFDFAVFDKSQEIRLLIEFDGEFHYFPIFGVEGLQYIKNNDTIKDLYCKDKKIPLLRIAYYDIKNIEEILSDVLFKSE